MATLSSVTPYVTLADANTINGIDTPWSTNGDTAKQAALVNGKMYIDEVYSCSWIETDPVPQNVQEANALLANYDLAESIFARQDNKGPITESTVKAGSVATTKKYGASNSGAGGVWLDPFPDVTALLLQGGVCELTKGSGAKAVWLNRA